MADRSKGHGNLGVRVVYKKNPKNAVIYWCNTESQRREIIREIIGDMSVVKSHSMVQRNHKSQGHTQR